MKVLTQEIMRHLFDYNADTGQLIRKNLPSVHSRKEKIGDVFGVKLPHKNGYFTGRLYDKTYKTHRLIWLWHTGSFPDEIDHIDGNPSNNKIDNLRSVTTQENLRNKKLYKNNVSGIVGVRFYVPLGRWLVRINNEFHKRIHIGYFPDFFEACCARKSAEKLYGYHANHGGR